VRGVCGKRDAVPLFQAIDPLPYRAFALSLDDHSQFFADVSILIIKYIDRLRYFL
jgi:hypothetical protein